MVIAPYWDDIDLSTEGGVYYNSYNHENGTAMLEQINSFLKRNASIEFNAKSAIVFRWVDVCPYGDEICDEVSIVSSYNVCIHKLTQL